MNQTKEEARHRVYAATALSLNNNPSREYLEELHTKAVGWVEKIEYAIHKLNMKEEEQELKNEY